MIIKQEKIQYVDSRYQGEKIEIKTIDEQIFYINEKNLNYCYINKCNDLSLPESNLPIATDFHLYRLVLIFPRSEKHIYFTNEAKAIFLLKEIDNNLYR